MPPTTLLPSSPVFVPVSGPIPRCRHLVYNKPMQSILAVITALLVVSISACAQRPTPSPSPAPSPTQERLGDPVLTKIDSLSETLTTHRYFELKKEGFRIQLPENYVKYVPSKPASEGGTDGEIRWNLAEANIVIMVGDMDATKLAAFTPAQKLQVLSASLTGKKGFTKVAERDLIVNGVPAREAKFKNGDQIYLARDLFVGSRLFVFTASLSTIENSEALVTQALDTFEAIK